MKDGYIFDLEANEQILKEFIELSKSLTAEENLDSINIECSGIVEQFDIDLIYSLFTSYSYDFANGRLIVLNGARDGAYEACSLIKEIYGEKSDNYIIATKALGAIKSLIGMVLFGVDDLKARMPESLLQFLNKIEPSQSDKIVKRKMASEGTCIKFAKDYNLNFAKIRFEVVSFAYAYAENVFSYFTDSESNEFLDGCRSGLQVLKTMENLTQRAVNVARIRNVVNESNDECKNEQRETYATDDSLSTCPEFETPIEWLRWCTSSIGRDIWRAVDNLRSKKGKKLDDWQGWCFLPFAGWYTVTCLFLKKNSLEYNEIGIMHAIAVAGTWRLTQDIVRFNPILYTEVASTIFDDKIPSSILFQIPSWCIYIETPLIEVGGENVYGVWVMLEDDVQGFDDELRIFLFTGKLMLTPIVLAIGDWTVEEAVQKILEQDIQRGLYSRNELSEELYQRDKNDIGIRQIINLILYVCAYGFPDRADTTSSKKQKKQQKKTKHGWRTFPAQQPRVHIIGDDIGRRIVEYKTSKKSINTSHSSPRPHIRRAHWHGYWYGKKNIKQEFKLKWLPPIPVAMAEDE